MIDHLPPLTPRQLETGQRRVVIDPGHGLVDPGAVGQLPWLLQESEVVFSVALGVRIILEDAGVAVLTTRSQGVRDVKFTLSQRVKVANEFAPDLFVSIHANAFGDSSAHGVEILHYGSTSGEALALAILQHLVNKPDSLPNVLQGQNARQAQEILRNRGAKKRATGRGSHLLKNTNAPAALVELPFISNPLELEQLAAAGFQVHFSRAIAAGIIERLPQ